MKRTITDEELTTPLVAYGEAIDLVIGSFEPLEPKSFLLDEALGLVATDDVIAGIDVPGFASSAMDGYAVRAADVNGATNDSPVTIRARKIMTGWEVPDDTDAIVPWEDTDRGDDIVTVYAATEPGRFVRPAGEDVRAGERVIRRGDRLTALKLGVLASIGRDRVRAHPRPRVAIASTGDELALPGADLPRGHMYDANATLLNALVRNAGANVVETTKLPDEPSAIAAWFDRAANEADLIVTSGGASVGEHDFVRDVLADRGKVTMWRVAVKPGKPIAFGRIGSARVIVLPGNPGSAFAGAHCFVTPAIKRMLGRDASHRSVMARLTQSVTGSPTRTLLCRVRIDGASAIPLPAQSSVVLSNLVGADGFAIVPPGGLAEDAEVRVELFDS